MKAVVSGLLAIAAALSIGIASCLQAQDLRSPIVTSEGELQGFPVADGRVIAFEGIPYAAPPIGNLRWRPPEPPKLWSGIKKANKFGSSCVQNADIWLPFTKEFITQNEMSEDCLYLNVWAPAHRQAAALPVLIFIHGGGFGGGSGAIDVYNGANLAQMGVVVVTINYRVGDFSFLALPELTAESPHHASGNYGLLDQVAALKWVKDNIGAFNGDPGNVTICGQSAGAASVHYLTASPLAKGLFQRTIAESGSGMTGFPIRSLAEAEKAGAELLASHHVNSLTEARALPASEFLAKGSRSLYEADVDGWFLPEDVIAIFGAGRQNDVPMLTGGTSGDPTLFMDIASAGKYSEWARKDYGDLARRYLDLYPAKTDAEAKSVQEEAAQDRSRVSTYLWALRRNQTSKTPAFIYYFDRATPWPGHPEFGAFHTSEVPYVFRNLGLVDHPYEPIDYKVSDQVSRYWVNFIRTGNPNGKNLPTWPSVSSQDKVTEEIGARIGTMPLADQAKVKFWEDYFASPAGKNAPIF